MSYTKLGFSSGQILKAEHLNHIEDGIATPSWNDLTDKPFGETTESVVIYENEKLGAGPMLLERDGTETLMVSDLVAGDTYIVNVNGVDYTGVAEQYEDPSSDNNIGIRLFSKGEIPMDFSDAPIDIGSYGNALYVDFEDSTVPHSVKIAHVKRELKTLDPKYLPEEVKDGASEPLIGDFNTVSNETWIEYAKKLIYPKVLLYEKTSMFGDYPWHMYVKKVTHYTVEVFDDAQAEEYSGEAMLSVVGSYYCNGTFVNDTFGGIIITREQAVEIRTAWENLISGTV